MLTQCPKCETIYRLGAADLAVARGFVECGECAEQFNALDRIADEPRFSPEQSRQPNTAAAAPSPAFILLDSGDSTSSGEPVGEPEAAVSVSGESTAIDLEPVVAEIEQGTLFGPPPEPDEETIFGVARQAAISELTPVDIDGAESAKYTPPHIASPAVVAPAATVETDRLQTPVSPRLSESGQAILFADPSAEFEDETEDEIESFAIDDVPAILQGEVAALGHPRRRSSGKLWVLLGSVLIAGLGLQLAWVFRDSIVEVLPDAQPVYLAGCERLGCRYGPAVAPGAIELISRDVRDHPQYLETLLVNATLISRSDTSTAFPIIQLGLYTQTGEAIGIRRFEPREYLDKSIDLAAGMPPNRPVYIVMEIGGIGSRAVSFEFAFL